VGAALGAESGESAENGAVEDVADAAVDAQADDLSDGVAEVSGEDVAADEVAETVVKPSPRPAGKRRAVGTSVPSDLSAAEQGAAEPVRDDQSPEQRAAVARNRTINWAIALGVVALILAGLAIWFRGQADSLTGGADDSNRALTDAAATSEVKGKLTFAIEHALSYNFTDLDATARAVKENLAGTAVCEYDKLFGQLKELAPAQKLVLTTVVRELGVTRLEGGKADLLVFVDQSTTRTDQNQTTASGAQFGIRAEKIDGTWKITDFDMLDQPLPGGQAAPTC
jgi:Mce-associated membrane protein